jgi:hypothetical protein
MRTEVLILIIVLLILLSDELPQLQVTVSADLLNTFNNLIFRTKVDVYYVAPRAEPSIPSGQYLLLILGYIKFVSNRFLSREATCSLGTPKLVQSPSLM